MEDATLKQRCLVTLINNIFHVVLSFAFRSTLQSCNFWQKPHLI